MCEYSGCQEIATIGELTREHEHRVIEAVLAETAAGVPSDPTWPRRLLETLELLRDHILKEQDGLFPGVGSARQPQPHSLDPA